MEFSLSERKILLIGAWQLLTPAIVLFVGWLTNSDEKKIEKLAFQITGIYYVTIIFVFVGRCLVRLISYILEYIIDPFYQRYPTLTTIIFIIIALYIFSWLSSLGSPPPDDVYQYEDGYW